MLRIIMPNLARAQATTVSCVAIFILSIAGVGATTIQRVDMAFLLANSQLIFEGEVVNHKAAWNPQHTSISTAVRFRVRDVLKGSYLQEFITLNYAGGVVGDQGMRVSAMVYPEVGEVGIYFIENTKQKLINPMVGWGQGHYVIEKDSAGRERILTEGKHPIVEVETDRLATPDQGRRQGGHQDSFSEGIASGIKTAPRHSGLSNAMDKQDFKNIVRGKIQRMRVKEEQ